MTNLEQPSSREQINEQQLLSQEETLNKQENYEKLWKALASEDSENPTLDMPDFKPENITEIQKFLDGIGEAVSKSILGKKISDLSYADVMKPDFNESNINALIQKIGETQTVLQSLLKDEVKWKEFYKNLQKIKNLPRDVSEKYRTQPQFQDRVKKQSEFLEEDANTLRQALKAKEQLLNGDKDAQARIEGYKQGIKAYESKIQETKASVSQLLSNENLTPAERRKLTTHQESLNDELTKTIKNMNDELALFQKEAKNISDKKTTVTVADLQSLWENNFPELGKINKAQDQQFLLELKKDLADITNALKEREEGTKAKEVQTQEEAKRLEETKKLEDAKKLEAQKEADAKAAAAQKEAEAKAAAAQKEAEEAKAKAESLKKEAEAKTKAEAEKFAADKKLAEWQVASAADPAKTQEVLSSLWRDKNSPTNAHKDAIAGRRRDLNEAYLWKDSALNSYLDKRSISTQDVAKTLDADIKNINSWKVMVGTMERDAETYYKQLGATKEERITFLNQAKDQLAKVQALVNLSNTLK